MQEYKVKRTSSPLSRHPVWAASLAIALLGSAGFAAAGGADVVKEWFITIQLDDGAIVELIDQGNITISEDGDTTSVTIDELELGTGDDGAEHTATITMEFLGEGNESIEIRKLKDGEVPDFEGLYMDGAPGSDGELVEFRTMTARIGASVAPDADETGDHTVISGTTITVDLKSAEEEDVEYDEEE